MIRYFIVNDPFQFELLGEAAGETGLGEAAGLLCALILFSSALSTVATVAVSASICARTFSGGTLSRPGGTSNVPASIFVTMSRISATIFAPFTPFTLLLASVNNSERKG